MHSVRGDVWPVEGKPGARKDSCPQVPRPRRGGPTFAPPVDEEWVDDPWAWTDQEDAESDHVDLSGCHLIAVLVAMDAARWLPGTLAAIARLTHRPTRLIAIDNASTDSTRALLDRAADQGVLDAVYDGKRSYGFGAAVQAALAQDRREAGEHPESDFGGCRRPQPLAVAAARRAAPAPDALSRLLAHIVVDQSIDITGPKLVLPKSRHSGSATGGDRREHLGHRTP